MSELSNVIEARLTAAEGGSGLAAAVSAAQSTANIADTKADMALANLTVGIVAPVAPVLGQLWSDTSQSGVLSLKMFSGADWVQLNPA